MKYKTKEGYDKAIGALKKGQENYQKRLKEIKEDYNKNPTAFCLFCNKPIEYYLRNKNKFCSHSCSALYNNLKKLKKQKFCINCNKPCKKNADKYCSKICQHKFNNQKKLEDWRKEKWDGLGETKKYLSEVIKNYLLEKYNNSCKNCGWNKINEFTKKVPLNIHHKDGNYRNNKEDNLEVLCPNCHSLTETWGGRNKGKGREYRYK